MRIEQVRFKNLNSLIGEWEIDFTYPAFVADGIFSITGPTGAGKTTILDAICLALFGRTPRLNKVTKSENEIMSRQTGECFAEVTFSTRNGYFRCHWSQHRAHKKPTGELQSPRHELAEADSKKIMETRLTEVSKQIETLTGMDFARFTRSMLLAQGEFAAFLKAAADERAPILEQITGTEIYSRISIRAHETRATIRRELDRLLAEFTGIQSLTKIDEEQYRIELTQKMQQNKLLNKQISHERQILSWLENIDQLETELKQLTELQQTWQKQKEIFTPESKKLDKANRALELAGEYSRLISMRNEQEAEQNKLTICTESLPKMEQALNHAKQTVTSTLTQFDHKRAQLQEAIPLIREARTLDIQLQEKKIPIKAARQAITEQRKIHTALIHQHQQNKVQLDNLQTTLINLLQQIDTDWTDKIIPIDNQEILKQSQIHSQNLLDQKQAAYKQLLNNKSLTDWQQELMLLAEHKTLIAHLSETAETLKELKQTTSELEKRLNALQSKKIQLTEQHKTQEMVLAACEREIGLLETKMLLLQKINNLEEARQQLQDNQPCPLCGALHHPYAAGNTPKPDQTTKELNQARGTLKTQGDYLSQIKIKQAEVNKDIAQIICQQQDNHQKILRYETVMQQHAPALSLTLSSTTPPVHVQLQLSQLLQTTDSKLIQVRQILQTAETVANEISTLREVLDKIKALGLEIGGILVELQHQDSQLQQQETALQQQQQQLDQLQQVLTTLHTKRHQLFADKQPDQEELLLTKAVAVAQKQVDNAQQQLTTEEQAINKLRHRAEDLKKSMARRFTLLTTQEAAFATKLHQTGFDNETAFTAACLTEEERKQLAQRAQQLADEKTALDTKQQDKTVVLEAEQLKHLTNQSKDFHEQVLTELIARQQALQQEIGGIQQKLKTNEQAKQKQQEQLHAIDTQKQECVHWDSLHELIGSADGKKYRNFAQGLTFEVMIRHANRQLQKMSDRYLLIRDKTRPLELNVVDNYQAGEIRSTKNLSGGESFIISLALALGLSHMVSRNIQVDSLFLDEGFGTLDEEALDIALETLASLQQEGKLIGIISHVSALQERISTQIQVIPQSSGKSLLSGPGCRYLR
jgi:exonuclease SbcC